MSVQKYNFESKSQQEGAGDAYLPIVHERAKVQF